LFYKIIKLWALVPLWQGGQKAVAKTERRQMNYETLPEKEESVAKKIVNAAYLVHKNLGPGLLERVYEVCFCHELAKQGITYKRQIDIPVIYDGMTFDEGLRLDVLVEGLIICELKAFGWTVLELIDSFDNDRPW